MCILPIVYVQNDRSSKNTYRWSKSCTYIHHFFLLLRYNGVAHRCISIKKMGNFNLKRTYMKRKTPDYLPETIKVLRIIFNYSQKFIASKLDVRQSTVSDIENSIISPCRDKV